MKITKVDVMVVAITIAAIIAVLIGSSMLGEYIAEKRAGARHIAEPNIMAVGNNTTDTASHSRYLEDQVVMVWIRVDANDPNKEAKIYDLLYEAEVKVEETRGIDEAVRLRPLEGITKDGITTKKFVFILSPVDANLSP